MQDVRISLGLGLSAFPLGSTTLYSSFAESDFLLYWFQCLAGFLKVVAVIALLTGLGFDRPYSSQCEKRGHLFLWAPTKVLARTFTGQPWIIGPSLKQPLWSESGVFWQGLCRVLISGHLGAGVKVGLSSPKTSGAYSPLERGSLLSKEGRILGM